MDWLEDFWGDLLSEEPLRIVAAWTTLDDEQKVVVYGHLTQMATQEGWASVQQAAAEIALKVIDDAVSSD